MTFRKITPDENRYLRMGLYGKAGSGKTRTATEVAMGLALDGEHHAIAFVDTEGNGVDYMLKPCQSAGVELYGKKTRDFGEVLESFSEVPGIADVLIIDSVSHIWKELLERYQREKNRSFLQFQDWGPIKEKWAKLTNAFLGAQFHTIVCGRAGTIYEQTTDDRGKKEITAVGTKMRAEGEFEHEPSLLLEMHLVQVPGHKPVNRAVVLKDRSDTMNGMEVDYPTYASFEPVIRALSPNGKHVALDASKETGQLFGSDDWSSYRRKQRKEELLERVSSAFILAELGTSKDDKKRKTELFRECFGTTSGKEAFNRLDIDALENGVRQLEATLEVNPGDAVSKDLGVHAEEPPDDLPF
ncbi:MAG: AAA family ATPase [Planctomycetota bacterium]|jgi:hypothetical protein